MFNFFKKPTSEERLSKELAGAIQSTVNLALKEFPFKPTQGMYVMMAINSCKQTARDKAPYLARKYDITVTQVYSVIDKCHKKALDYFLE